MARVIELRAENLKRQAGERARLKVAYGPDRGKVYVLTGDHASIGRSGECDICLGDLKASRKHAKFYQEEINERWYVQDLESANGLLHNGHPSRFSPLKNGDHVTLGETVLEFYTQSASTGLLMAPAKDRARINEEQKALDRRVESVRAIGGLKGLPVKKAKVPEPGKFSKSTKSLPAPAAQSQFNPRTLVYLLIIGGLGVSMIFEEDPKSKNNSNTTTTQLPLAGSNEQERRLARINQKKDLQTADLQAERFYKQGFREFREKNYLRALKQFDQALLLDPSHRLAKKYLLNAEKAIEQEVEFHLSRGRRSLDAGRLRRSRGHYEAVLRLLHRNRGDSRYIEAEEQLKQITASIREG